jgi:cardiolipin synthase
MARLTGLPVARAGESSALWLCLAGALVVILALAASGHAVLYKRDSRAAVAWLGFIWLVPVAGPLLYSLLGINRIRRRAQMLRPRDPQTVLRARPASSPPEQLPSALVPDSTHLHSLARLVGTVTRRPLVAGNRVVPLPAPDHASTAMLEVMRGATASLALSTYIFDNDRLGRLFVEELRRAVQRGVQVRVLIDDLGSRYSWPRIVGPLRRAGVPLALFMPRWLPRSLPYANLRNHRKVLVVDGRVGFTGGMNVRDGFCPTCRPGGPIDLHFRIEGPVVAQLQAVFSEDWAFCTGERLLGKHWFPHLEPAGGVLARVISDGPDEDFEKLRLTLLGALACARSSVRILTPYFLPDPSLIAALDIAALRGVLVDILLPARSNLRLVQWASTALLWQVLEHGCRVWLAPPPFDHSKLMVVDGTWSLLGSANWDPRSLRLNFELNVECYDRTLAAELERVIEGKLQQARPLTLADVDGRSVPVKLRDGLARLLSPYL